MEQEDLTRARNRLAAGRIRAMEKAPYLSTALLSLEPREIIGFGTFAVDQKWIIYYDPQKCLDWSIDEIAAVWLHEISHVIRNHADRFNATGDPTSQAEFFNIAADAAINSDLRDMGVSLPDADKRWYAEKNPMYPKWRRNMTAEEMYSIAKKGKGKPQEQDPGKGKPDESQESEEKDDKTQESSSDSPNDDLSDENSEESIESSDSTEKEDNASDEKEDSDNESGDSDSSDVDKEDSDNEAQDDSEKDSGNESGENDSDEDSEGDGDTEDSSDGESSDGSGEESDEDSEAGEGESSEGDSEERSDGDQSSEESDGDGDADSDASSEGSEGNPEDSESDHGSEGHSHEGNCGSGAHGVPQEYEVDDGSGFDPMEAEQMRRQVAQEINDYNERYGSVPGGMVRDAKEILDPQVDWTEELLSQVRKEIATVVGQSDYTYSRPSRRASQTPFILPSMRQAPPPEIVVILDTSGSMKIHEELAQALGEMEELIESAARHSTLGGIRIINCDAGANIPVIVSDLNDFEIIGGGGTDMRVGIKAASELDPPAGIIITMTDGFTPWPREVPEDNEDALYIALIIDSSKKKKGASQQRGWSTTGIPDWITVIEVQT
jgi:predicted metal-dependent peptidase